MLTGGETAREVLDRLGSPPPSGRSRRLEHGALLSLAARTARLVATKPGSFGDETPSSLHLDPPPRLRTRRHSSQHTRRFGNIRSRHESAPLNTKPPPDTRPFIAVTMGDGAGVGPEVTVGALVDRGCLPRADRRHR